jgi:hypothetical protein
MRHTRSTDKEKTLSAVRHAGVSLGWVFLTIICVLLSNAAHGQGSTANRGILLKPQSGGLLQHGGGCTVGMLNLRIATGKDDLRGGKENLNVEVHFSNGDMQTATNVNNGANWPNDSVNSVSIHLNRPVSSAEIKSIRLVHSAQSSYVAPSGRQGALTASPITGPVLGPIYAAEGIKTEDNWDMAQLQAFGLGAGINAPVAAYGFHRFTGSNPSLDINAQPAAGCPSGNQVRSLSFTFSTANDNLRGGNDNLNITVLFADGTSQSEANVNHSQRWQDGSTKGAEILLNRSVTIDQIRGLTLETTFTGGSGGDNWNMASMQADAILAGGSHHTIAKSGFHRFSSDWSGPKAKTITIGAHVIN